MQKDGEIEYPFYNFYYHIDLTLVNIISHIEIKNTTDKKTFPVSVNFSIPYRKTNFASLSKFFLVDLRKD